jgi:signal transduction histidine kinase
VKVLLSSSEQLGHHFLLPGAARPLRLVPRTDLQRKTYGIEAGKMPLHIEEFELPTLVSELLAEVEPLIQKARLQTVTRIGADLPPLHFDRQKVKQIPRKGKRK